MISDTSAKDACPQRAAFLSYSLRVPALGARQVLLLRLTSST
jgi:hypothetical protein